MGDDGDDFDIYGDTTTGQYAGTKEENAPYGGGDDTFMFDVKNEGGRQEEDAQYDSHERSSHNADDDGDFPETPAVFVGNLTWWTTDQQIEDLCSRYGKIKTVKFFEDKVNGKSKGYAFVEFGSMEQAKAAKDQLQGKNIGGKECLINYVSPSNYRSLTSGGPPKYDVPPMNVMPNAGRGMYNKRGGPPMPGRGGFVPGKMPASFPPRDGGFPPRGGRGMPFRGGYVPRGGFYPPGVVPHVNPNFFPPGDYGGYGGGGGTRRDYDDYKDDDRDRDSHRDRDRDTDKDRDRDDRDHSRKRDRDSDDKRSRDDRDRDERSHKRSSSYRDEKDNHRDDRDRDRDRDDRDRDRRDRDRR